MTKISPISAAEHYAVAAHFWENEAKRLRAERDLALEQVVELKQPPDAPTPKPQTKR